MIKNKYTSAAFKMLVCLAGLVGICIQCGVFSGRFDFAVLRYYTLLSNLLCVMYFGPAAIYALKGKGILMPGFKGALVMGITVTGLVFHFMLSDSMFSMGGAQAAANILLHYAVPAGAVLDWLLFDRKGRFTPMSPVKWTLLPDIYFILATVYGFTLGSRLPFYGGARFPYFFIDYDVLGVWGVLAYVAVLNLFFIALGFVFFFIDRLLARKKL